MDDSVKPSEQSEPSKLGKVHSLDKNNIRIKLVEHEHVDAIRLHKLTPYKKYEPGTSNIYEVEFWLSYTLELDDNENVVDYIEFNMDATYDNEAADEELGLIFPSDQTIHNDYYEDLRGAIRGMTQYTVGMPVEHFLTHNDQMLNVTKVNIGPNEEGNTELVTHGLCYFEFCT